MPLQTRRIHLLKRIRTPPAAGLFALSLGALLLLLIAGFPGPAVNAAAEDPVGTSPIPVPWGDGTTVLLDGRFEAEEWRDAAVVTAPGGLELRFKRHGAAVYIGVRTPGEIPRPVDLYVTDGNGPVRQIHASMATGERFHEGHGCDVPDLPWTWYHHPGWTSNQAHLDRTRSSEIPLGLRLHPAEGVEFKIRRALIPGIRWRLRLDVGTFPGDEGTFSWPANADCRDPGTWAVLELP